MTAAPRATRIRTRTEPRLRSGPLPGHIPPKDCPLCPRLQAFRNANQRAHPDWYNAPVPGWGDDAPKLMIVGLAPGLRGANRTGRPFTGDHAGDLLFETLSRLGMTSGAYDGRPDDGLALSGVRICNAVACVPPQNKPIGAEIATCRKFLTAALGRFAGARTLLALGRIAHDSALAALGEKRSGFAFAHGARHRLGDGRVLFDSYHCSRYNTNTGRLTAEMFATVMAAAKADAGIG